MNPLRRAPATVLLKAFLHQKELEGFRRKLVGAVGRLVKGLGQKVCINIVWLLSALSLSLPTLPDNVIEEFLASGDVSGICAQKGWLRLLASSSACRPCVEAG